MKRTLSLMVILASLCCLSVFAEEAATVLSADDTEAIAKSLGAEITVEGKVHNAFWVKGKVLMITFREGKEGFVAVSFAKHRKVLDAGFEGNTVAAIKGKTVRITGTVTEHNDRPQIVVEKPEQIALVPSPTP